MADAPEAGIVLSGPLAGAHMRPDQHGGIGRRLASTRSTLITSAGRPLTGGRSTTPTRSRSADRGTSPGHSLRLAREPGPSGPRPARFTRGNRRRSGMHGFAVRGFIVIPALAALMILAVGCSSSGQTSPPKASPTATSQSPPSTTSGVAAACQKIQKTLAQAPTTLGNLALHPSTAKPQVTAFINKLKTEAAAAGSPALTSAVNQFASAVQRA